MRSFRFEFLASQASAENAPQPYGWLLYFNSVERRRAERENIEALATL
jgi:hypothetical protein